ncbi:MAG: hypothetical protein UZ21_OP11001001064 [Microgenomates bacterium OLB22]|nr:MAG: hypothetical protein UZ21_OP11001001064 [Microgenomates bacterium OLB22]
MLDLSSKPRVIGADYYTAPFNQLYHPTGQYRGDTYDIVYMRDALGATKFDPILLKESFFLATKGGYVIFDYRPTAGLDFTKLETLLWWLWQKRYDIVSHGALPTRRIQKSISRQELCDLASQSPNQEVSTRVPTSDRGYMRCILKKNTSTAIPGDSIQKWTFGIITNGVRLDLIEEIITSIKQQKIPYYEIIICGNYHDRDEHNIHYVPFTQRDDLGWISRKKKYHSPDSKI